MEALLLASLYFFGVVNMIIETGVIFSLSELGCEIDIELLDIGRAFRSVLLKRQIGSINTFGLEHGIDLKESLALYASMTSSLNGDFALYLVKFRFLVLYPVISTFLDNFFLPFLLLIKSDLGTGKIVRMQVHFLFL